MGADNGTGPAAGFSNREIAYYEIGTMLTPTEVANDYTAIQKFQTSLNRAVGLAVHPDTQAALDYLVSVGVVLPNTQVTLLDRHVRDLHGEPNPNAGSIDIWAKMKAIYPFIGGTAEAHRLNLRDPSKPLILNGAMTHSATGCLFQGGYANTTLNMLGLLTNGGFGYYSRTDYRPAAAVSVMMGCGGPNASRPTTQNTLQSSNSNFGAELYGYGAGQYISVAASLTSAALLSFSRVSATDLRLYRNGAQLALATTALTGAPTSSNVYIGAYNDNAGTPLYQSPTECAYAQINTGLSSLEENRYYFSIFELQKGLGRGVTLGFDERFGAATILILGLLLSLGITLTLAEQEALNELITGIPLPSPAPGMMAMSMPAPTAEELMEYPEVKKFLKKIKKYKK